MPKRSTRAGQTGDHGKFNNDDNRMGSALLRLGGQAVEGYLYSKVQGDKSVESGASAEDLEGRRWVEEVGESNLRYQAQHQGWWVSGVHERFQWSRCGCTLLAVGVGRRRGCFL